MQNVENISKYQILEVFYPVLSYKKKKNISRTPPLLDALFRVIWF